MEGHPDRECVIALYRKDPLGGAQVKTLVDPPNHEIVFYADASTEPPALRPLQLSFALIADHDAKQPEEILDSQRVIDRMRQARTEPVTISSNDLD